MPSPLRQRNTRLGKKWCSIDGKACLMYRWAVSGGPNITHDGPLMKHLPCEVLGAERAA